MRQEVIAADFSNNRQPPLWVRESPTSNAEVDLLIQHDGLIVPVEVRAGKTGVLRSLHQFVQRADHPYALRMYKGRLEIVENSTPTGIPYKLLNLPYFLSGKIKEYLEWFMTDPLLKE